MYKYGKSTLYKLRKQEGDNDIVRF